MASELRVNSSTNRSGLGTITYTDSGPIVSGVGTFANGLTVDGTQTTVKSLKLTGDNYNANWFKTSNKLRFNDSAKATFGTADDLSVYHDGNNSYIQDVGTGQLRFLSNDYVFYNAGGNENLLRITENSGVSLYDGANTVRLATTNAGATVTGDVAASGNISCVNLNPTGFLQIDDTSSGGNLYIGNNSDLKLFHNGSTNFIRSGAGGHTIHIDNNSGVVGAKFIPAGAVELYYNGTKRLETTNTGAVVTGILTATSFSGNLTGNVTGTASANAVLTGSTNNQLVTVTGANALNGEAKLTFDGNQLYIDCQSYQEPILINSTQASVRATIRQTNDANANSGLTIQKRHSSLHPANYWYGDIQFQGWDGSGYHRAGLIECVAEGTPANDNMPGMLRFSTNAGAASQTERFRITAGGQLRLMEGNSVKMSVYNDGSQNFITSNSGQEIKVSSGNGDSNGIEFWDYTGGNKRCQIDGHGIKFNTDTAAANALDDYEEGDHDTTVTMSGDTSFTYTNRTLAYTKIGRVVHITGRILMNGCSGSTFRFTLPFTCGNGNVKYETSNEFQNIRFDDGYTFRIRSNTAYADLQSDGADTGITNNPHINVSLTYFTA